MDDFNISQGLSNETPQMNSSFVLVELVILFLWIRNCIMAFTYICSDIKLQ